jgi:hypothetical protein
MAISRMQQPRQMYNQGMMVHDPRQAYGLGGFIKKAVRGVKKIAKSPLGKAALIYAGGMGLGSIGSGLTGMARFAPSNFMGNMGRIGSFGKSLFAAPGGGPAGSGKGGFLQSLVRDEDGNFSIGKAGLLGLGATAVAMPFLGGKGDDDDEGSQNVMDPAAVTQRARNYYSGQGNAGVGLDFMPKKKYVSQNFYAADGGRAGYANGQLVTPSGDGSRPGYAGERVSTEENLFRTLPGNTNDRFLMPENVPPRNKKFDFMFETGPITDRNLEILNNMTAEERKAFEEQGSPFDIIEKFIDIPFQIRGEEIIEEKYAQGGRAGYAMGGSLDEDEEDYIRSGAGQSRRMPTAFLNMGGGAGEAQAEQMLMAEFVKYKNKGGDLSFQQFVQAVMQQQEQSQGMQQPTMMAANGGLAGMTSVPGYGTPAGTNQFGYPSGGVRVGKAEGGIMETEQAEMIDMGGQEKDYRDEGGFVAMGGEERADDVPARLSKNEFVFTADAVRNAGGGDIDRGSEVMQNLMDNLEQGGQVSEDSQGLGGGEEMMSEEIIQEPDGAQAMYEQQQALQSRMA